MVSPSMTISLRNTCSMALRFLRNLSPTFSRIATHETAMIVASHTRKMARTVLPPGLREAIRHIST